MRKLLCILVFLLLFCVSGVQGYNIAHRFGCDTLIMRGNRSQLKELENVILGMDRIGLRKYLRAYYAT